MKTTDTSVEEAYRRFVWAFVHVLFVGSCMSSGAALLAIAVASKNGIVYAGFVGFGVAMAVRAMHDYLKSKYREA